MRNDGFVWLDNDGPTARRTTATRSQATETQPPRPAPTPPVGHVAAEPTAMVAEPTVMVVRTPLGEASLQLYAGISGRALVGGALRKLKRTRLARRLAPLTQLVRGVGSGMLGAVSRWA